MRKIAGVAALMISSQLSAQDSTKPQPIQTLNEVVVTATKFPKNQNETGKVINVIGRDILDKSSGRTVGELLQEQSGITVIGANNNLGTNQDVYMRGAGLGKTLILIDGIPAYDPSSISTPFDLNLVPLDNVERIEIVKGAQSTMYGSDAVAGVINIITRKPMGKGNSGHVTLAWGSFKTFKLGLNLNGSLKKMNYNFGYTSVKSNGFSTAKDTIGNKNFDNDFFRQKAFQAGLGYQFCEATSARIYGNWSRYRTGLDAGSFRDERDREVYTPNAQYGINIIQKLAGGSLNFNYNFNKVKRDYLDDSSFVGGFSKYDRSVYEGRAHFAELYYNRDLGKHLGFLIGGEFRRHDLNQDLLSISSFGPYISKTGRDSTYYRSGGAFASLFLKNFGGFSTELGGRWNKHSVYGDNFTYSINPSYQIIPAVRVFANLASGFKAPSLYQIYSSGKKVEVRPEESITFEAGAEFKPFTGARIRGVYFNREIQDGIDYNYVTYSYFNYNLQKDHGFEAELELKKSIFTFRGNYTYVTGLGTLKKAALGLGSATADTTLNNLFRRAPNTVNLYLGVQIIKPLYVSLSSRWVADRTEFIYGQKPVTLASYSVVDAYIEYKLKGHIAIFGNFSNIFDKDYMDIYGFNSRPFNFMAGIRVM